MSIDVDIIEVEYEIYKYRDSISDRYNSIRCISIDKSV